MKKFVTAGLGTAVLAASASADITGAYVVSYEVTAEDFGGASITVNVQDLYLSSNDTADTALNVYNLMLNEQSQISYFQSATSTGWLAQNAGGIFDNAALQQADSFVTIGGMDQDTLTPAQSPGAGSGSGLDPNFGGNNAAFPGENAGWYNGSPPSLNGQVGQVAERSGQAFGLGVMVGRFATTEFKDLSFTTLEVTWNEGLGTPGQQGEFIVNVPAPGAVALLGLAGLVGGGRRRG